MGARRVVVSMGTAVTALWLLVGCSATTSASHSTDAMQNTMNSMQMDHTQSAAAGAEQQPAPAYTGAEGEKDLPDGEKLAKYTVENGVKVFHLDARPVQWEVSKGVVKTVWAYNGTVPGPQIRVNEGDRVRIIVTNHLPEGTTVHWHGLEVPNAMDGVPMVTQDPIPPGKSFTYEFTVKQVGTFMYHSHCDDLKQVGMGLYGAFISLPRGVDKLPGVQVDLSFVLGDANLGYTINGKSFPDTAKPTLKVNKPVHVRLMNMGTMEHPFHLHGFYMTVLAKDGQPVPIPYKVNTVDLLPGDTYDVEFTPDRVGTWMFHCHILPHIDDGQGNMTGMITEFKVVK
jgi:FtsP/CotA-like multicopper oxidase with cupredoxin domain